MAAIKFGRYEIISELGRGGMATVYHAYDPHFERDVAVKVLPQEYLHHPSARPRFDREAKAIAALEHHAIVPVYDYGEENGQPFLVMRFMTGGSLGTRLRASTLSPRETAPILQRVGDALDAAHAQGMLHRDIKPDNILFDQRGEAYLADFGIVKLVQSTTPLTSQDMVMGTPYYISPEQVKGEFDPDGRADVYALGVLLFEMLTGDVPYDDPNATKLLMKHVLEPVPSILAVRPDMPAEFESIIARAMAKERDDRYQTAAALARAVAALAGGEALPPTEDVPSLYAPPATLHSEPQHTLKAHEEAVWSVVWSPDGSQLASGSYDGKVIVWDTGSGQQHNVLEAEGSAPAFSWAPMGQTQGVRTVAWSPEGRMLASGADDGIVTLFDADSGKQLGRLEGHERGVRTVAWSPDGSLLASGADDDMVIVWDIQTGQKQTTLEGHTRGVRSAAWSPDGSQLASGSYDGKVMLWNARSGERLGTLEGHTRGVRSVAWSPDGAQLAAALYDGTLTLWEAQAGERAGELRGHAESVHCVAWSPDGSRLASGGHEGAVILWQAHDGAQVGALQGHSDAVRSVAWSPDGSRLATGSDDHLVLIWSLPS